MSRINLVPKFVKFDEFSFNKFIRFLNKQLEGILNGRTRNQGSVTLTQSATTTVVNDPLFESHQTPVFTPLTATAAAEFGSLYVSSRGNGTFTITHSNTADTDKTLEYIFIG